MSRPALMRAAGLAIWLSTSLAGPVHAQTDCSQAATQLDMNFCARAGWENADGELNWLWGLVKPAADRAGRGAALLDAQRAWLRFRDATCEGEQAQYAGGSIAQMVYWSCMERVTRARNVDLRAMPQ